ncbi:MAG: hypothetical protein M1495_12345 [Bacteroidetes bacterium]|nr:hypothetical protein [Bacteroidota bacterium]
MRFNLASLIVVMLFVFTSINYSQTDQSLIKNGAPNIYVGCGLCDMDFVKEQIAIVNYVRDRKDADVHILFTSQRTAAGGTDYKLYFIGQNVFANMNDTLEYSTNQTDTHDRSRIKMVNALKKGLVRYIARTKFSDQMNISFAKPEKKEGEQKDDWNFWNFKMGINGNFSGQDNYKYNYFSGSISANRSTEDLKLSFKINASYNENIYTYYDGISKTDILSLSRYQSFGAYVVKAIDRNWSWGVWAGLSSSTYSNIDLELWASPGIEYNIFPYSVSNERQLRIAYKLRHGYFKYGQETIYFKTKENLWSHSLEINLSLVKPWGTISIGTEGANVLTNFNLYEMSVNGSVSLNLFKGFSLNFYGGYSKIRNQISLPRAGATLEEVLTQRRQLETQYSYWGGFGVSYSFGSIYNNIVNPRFGSEGGTTMIISY